MPSALFFVRIHLANWAFLVSYKFQDNFSISVKKKVIGLLIEIAYIDGF